MMNRDLNRNLYLMGFMGCGKTTVGRELANHLRLPFIDTDELIEEREGQSIPHIFKIQGEDYFRQMERRIIEEVTSLDGHIVSLGGGAVMNPDNWRRITQSGQTVTLAFPPGIIANRLSSQGNRPLLHDSGINLLTMIEYLSKQRESAYQKADVVLYYDSPVSAQTIVKDILSKLKSDDASD